MLQEGLAVLPAKKLGEVLSRIMPSFVAPWRHGVEIERLLLVSVQKPFLGHMLLKPLLRSTMEHQSVPLNFTLVLLIIKRKRIRRARHVDC